MISKKAQLMSLHIRTQRGCLLYTLSQQRFLDVLKLEVDWLYFL